MTRARARTGRRMRPGKPADWRSGHSLSGTHNQSADWPSRRTHICHNNGGDGQEHEHDGRTAIDAVRPKSWIEAPKHEPLHGHKRAHDDHRPARATPNKAAHGAKSGAEKHP